MKRTLALSLLLVLLGLLAGAALAQTGGYDLSWWTVDGGGATFSSGNNYNLGGTLGQPDAGALSGGGYTLAGGFWGGTASTYTLYLPVVFDNATQP